jgi:hypothetical protein
MEPCTNRKDPLRVSEEIRVLKGSSKEAFPVGHGKRIRKGNLSRALKIWQIQGSKRILFLIALQ